MLLTTHDRVEVTLACLTALRDQRDLTVDLDVVVCDAGSNDGTPDAVEALWPEATVLRQDASLYWAAGMRAAWAHAVEVGYDAYLWLNDDTLLNNDTLARLVSEAAQRDQEGARPAILVGATRDPSSGEITYSGAERTDPRRPLRWDRVAPTDEPQLVETMNGNCVLVPATVVEDVGLLDPLFTHGMADFDYGLRAGKAGHPIVLMPGTVGTCAANAAPSVRSVRDEWRAVRSTKDLPPAQWFAFARRWAGPGWPLYATAPYVRRMAKALTGRR